MNVYAEFSITHFDQFVQDFCYLVKMNWYSVVWEFECRIEPRNGHLRRMKMKKELCVFSRSCRVLGDLMRDTK